MNKFSHHAKFQSYTLLCFENSDNWKWLCRPETFSGLSRNGPLFRPLGPALKVPKNFPTRKATTKISKLFFHTTLTRTKITSMQSLIPIHCFLFEIQIIEKWFYGHDKLSGLSRNGPHPMKSSYWKPPNNDHLSTTAIFPFPISALSIHPNRLIKSLSITATSLSTIAMFYCSQFWSIHSFLAENLPVRPTFLRRPKDSGRCEDVQLGLCVRCYSVIS